MEKKSYIKGFLSGIIVVAVLAALCRGLYGVRTLAGGNLSADVKISTIEDYLQKYYVGDIDAEHMREGMYTGLVAGLGDPYTSYLSAQELADMTQDIEGRFEGIGVEVTSDPVTGSIIVLAPLSGSPAEQAGVLPNDQIIRVDGADISGLPLTSVVSRIKGPEGTNVTVTVYRESNKQVIDMDLVRSKIELHSVEHQLMPGGIGYIALSGFRENTYAQFQEAYNDLLAQDMKGLVLDLRNNPGGLVDSATSIGDLLLPEGTMVYTIDKNGKREDHPSDANRINIPLSVLVNGNTASASEIISGAVQDMKVGTLVGTQTFGKGLVQAFFPMTDGSALKITIQKYYTPNGVCIQGEGIAPDYVVELPEEFQNSLNIPAESDTQLQKAIEVIQAEAKQ